jgi:hypothetical protein
MGHAVDEDESSGGHFMAYFLVFIVLSIAGYIVFHNKQKVSIFSQYLSYL